MFKLIVNCWLYNKLTAIMHYYYTLNSLSLFWLTESVQWFFEISACDVITADYTIIMSRTLKVTGNHVLCDRSAWFLRVIMSSWLVFVLFAVSEEVKTWLLYFFRCIIKQLLDSVFCDIQNNQGLGKGYQPQPSADNPSLDLDYSGYHKNLIQ